MFSKISDGQYKDMLPGIQMRVTSHGDKTLMSEFLLKSGSKLPPHSHIHEQIGYLVSGRIILHIGDESFETLPGDSWCVKSGVTHSAEALENSTAVEVFSPVREEYLS